MGVIQEFFNNREIAIGIWVIIGLAVILPTKPARQFIKTAIPILFCKKFVIFYIVFLSFLGLVLFALNWAGLWDLTLLKDTVFWVLFVELPLFAKAIEKADGGRFFSNLIRENVAIVVAIEFFVGFWTFSLITEIILIPLTVLISVLQVLAGQDKKHRSAKRFFDGLLVLWGIILLINAIYSLIHAPNQFLSFNTLKSLLLPLVLLVFNLPVVYGLALYNTYEQIFIRIKGSKSEQKKMKWQVIRFSGINLSKVSAIRKSLPNTIVCCRTSNDLQINLKKLARRLDLQIGENYMKRSRYYVLACIAGLILSFIGLIGANSDVSLKDLVTLNFVFDIPRIKEILTNIFSTMIVFSATLFFFAIGFAKKQREDVSQIKKYALYELLLSVKMQHSQLVDYPPIDEPADLFCAYVHNVYGYNPRLLQYGAVVFAGVLAGIGGAQMSCIYTLGWANDMINGRGFIASALVILCSWKPLRAYMAAYLFGLAQALIVYLQVKGVAISMYFTMMLPYLLTLAALAVISTSKKPSMPEKIKVVSTGME